MKSFEEITQNCKALEVGKCYKIQSWVDGKLQEEFDGKLFPMNEYENRMYVENNKFGSLYLYLLRGNYEYKGFTHFLVDSDTKQQAFLTKEDMNKGYMNYKGYLIIFLEL